MSETITLDLATKLAPPSQVFVPVTAVGIYVVDNGGDRIAECFTPELAVRIADLLNRDAGF